MATLWQATLMPQVLSVEVRGFTMELLDAQQNGTLDICRVSINERAKVL
jgi:hypothetical protein